MSNPAGTVSVEIPGTATGASAPVVEKPATERPAWLPAKFNSPEDFAKSYAELETKLGSAAKPPVTPPATTEPPKLGDPVKTPPVATPATPAKADFSKYEAEFNTAGKFSDQSYTELEAMGISRAMADQYAQGVQAHQTQTRQEIYSTVGGEQQFQQVMTWAGTNLSEPEKAAYNSAVQSGNVAAIKLALAGMNARFTQTYGREPSLLGGKAPSQSGPAAFSSWTQVTAAMSDKRYETDPSYRAEVEQRIAVSKNL